MLLSAEVEINYLDPEDGVVDESPCQLADEGVAFMGALLDDKKMADFWYRVSEGVDVGQMQEQVLKRKA